MSAQPQRDDPQLGAALRAADAAAPAPAGVPLTAAHLEQRLRARRRQRCLLAAAAVLMLGTVATVFQQVGARRAARQAAADADRALRQQAAALQSFLSADQRERDLEDATTGRRQALQQDLERERAAVIALELLYELERTAPDAAASRRMQLQRTYADTAALTLAGLAPNTEAQRREPR